MKDSKSNHEEADDELKLDKPIYLFGKDIREIRCFRDSFICGISCGVGGGLLSFLVTSKTLLSTHVAFASLWIGVFGYWIPCRYRYENNILIAEKLKLNTKFNKSEKNEIPKYIV